MSKMTQTPASKLRLKLESVSTLRRFYFALHSLQRATRLAAGFCKLVLLKYSPAICLDIVCGSLPVTMAELSRCERG